jgi:hypothetical protein
LGCYFEGFGVVGGDRAIGAGSLEEVDDGQCEPFPGLGSLATGLDSAWTIKLVEITYHGYEGDGGYR